MNIDIISAQDLEIIKDDLLRKHQDEVNFKSVKNNEILLTGASGFLGVHILEVLSDKKLNKIHIIIRSFEKFLNQIEKYKKTS